MQTRKDFYIHQDKQHIHNIQEKSSSIVAFAKLEGLKHNIPVHRTERYCECSKFRTNYYYCLYLCQQEAHYICDTASAIVHSSRKEL